MNAEPFDHASYLPFSRRLAHPGMATLCDHWVRLCGGNNIPSYRDFDPLAVPRLLPDLQLTRRDADGRHRIDLTGARFADLMGRDNTGKFLDEILTVERYAVLAALYDGVLGAGLPIAIRAFLLAKDREHRFHTRLLLPFVDEGPKPDLVVAMAIATEPAPGEPQTLERDGVAEILVATRSALR